MTDEHVIEGRTSMSVNMVVQVAFWIIAAMLTYAAVVARVAVVENQVTSIDHRLDRIEAKVDALLDRRP